MQYQNGFQMCAAGELMDILNIDIDVCQRYTK